MERVVPARPPLQILDFSPRVREALRQIKMEVHRLIDESSPQVRVTNMRCDLCGFEHDVTSMAVVPADTLRATTFTHLLSWKTGKQCGGQFAFTSEPVERAVGIPILR